MQKSYTIDSSFSASISKVFWGTFTTATHTHIQDYSNPTQTRIKVSMKRCSENEPTRTFYQVCHIVLFDIFLGIIIADVIHLCCEKVPAIH